MKKLILSILVLLMVTNVVAAEEASQSVEDNKAVITVQKQPSNEVQKQKATRNIACIIIQINGKVKDTVNPASAR